MKYSIFLFAIILLQSCKSPAPSTPIDHFHFLVGTWKRYHSNDSDYAKNWKTVMNCTKGENEIICVTALTHQTFSRDDFFIIYRLYAEDGQWYWESQSNCEYLYSDRNKRNKKLFCDKHEISKIIEKGFVAKQVMENGAFGGFRSINFNRKINRLIVMSGGIPFHFERLGKPY